MIKYCKIVNTIIQMDNETMISFGTIEQRHQITKLVILKTNKNAFVLSTSVWYSV